MYAKRTELLDNNGFPTVILRAFHDDDTKEVSFKITTQGMALSIDMPVNGSKNAYCKTLLDIAQEIIDFTKYLKTI